MFINFSLSRQGNNWIELIFLLIFLYRHRKIFLNLFDFCETIKDDEKNYKEIGYFCHHTQERSKHRGKRNVYHQFFLLLRHLLNVFHSSVHRRRRHCIDCYLDSHQNIRDFDTIKIELNMNQSWFDTLTLSFPFVKHTSPLFSYNFHF